MANALGVLCCTSMFTDSLFFKVIDGEAPGELQLSSFLFYRFCLFAIVGFADALY